MDKNLILLDLARTKPRHFLDVRTFIGQNLDAAGQKLDNTWARTNSGHMLDKFWTYIGQILDMDINWTKSGILQFYRSTDF